MKNIIIPKIDTTPQDAAEVPALLDANGVRWNLVGCNNWPVQYPYTPEAIFRVALTDSAFLINYKAKEETVRAVVGCDNGEVWTDSCMEFFLSPSPEDGSYYNLECNCAGKVLLGVRGGSLPKGHIAPEVLATISRWSSLGDGCFDDRPTAEPWQVALVVPFSVYGHHDVAGLIAEGVAMRANFYKCGDKLPRPHFLSWAPIESETPCFHLPEFFGELKFK